MELSCKATSGKKPKLHDSSVLVRFASINTSGLRGYFQIVLFTCLAIPLQIVELKS